MTTPLDCRSLYVHVPFCRTICGYCDFYSEVFDRGRVGPLVDALLAELAGWSARKPIVVDTIFVGGGTPTTLPPAELRRLLGRLADLRDEAAAIEFTVEANPASVSEETAGALVESGVNRVSIGAQSFDTGELRVLERIHQPEQVARTVEICRAAGIAAINLDLIFAIPGQTVAQWRRNLDAAVALGPDHLSCYGLTYERGTPLFRQLEGGLVQRVDDSVEAEMFDMTIDVLTAAGYHQYEISNFARAGCECRHNLRYWHNESYLGIGPSAAGFVEGARYKNIPDTAEYVRAISAGRAARIEEERLSLDARARETAMLELRLREGIARRRFAERFAHDPARLFAEAIEKHRSAGLLEVDDATIHLTRRGLLMADSVMADFL